MKALAARSAVETVPAVIEIARDPNENVRVAAFDTLVTLGGPDHLSALVTLLAEVDGDAARAKAEEAATAVALGIDDETARAAPFLDALRPARKNVPARCSLLTVLGDIHGEGALKALKKASKARNADVRDAAVRALANWPTAGALDVLERVAKRSKNEQHRILALRGYVRLLGLPSTRTAAKQLKRYEKAMDLAQRSDERVLVIDGLANVRDPGVLAVLESYVDHPELGDAAKAAIQRVKSIE